MRKQTIRTILILAVMFLGTLTAVSNSTVKEAKAMPYQVFLQEYHLYYPDIINDINFANQYALYTVNTANGTQVATSIAGIVASWNSSMLNLKFWVQEIDRELKTLPYAPFSMDKLLLKFDNALYQGTQATAAAKAAIDYANLYLTTYCPDPPTRRCAILFGTTTELHALTIAIKEEVVALGFLFTKAKLEFLEFPRLSCFPLQIAVAGKLYCSGQSVNGTATLQINNTQTGAMTKIGQSQADPFFDVFFEVTLPSSIGTGHWQAVITDSGGAQASSFFDVFVTLPTAFEPTTIIPLTVLIAAVATLAVASRKVRRLN